MDSPIFFPTRIGERASANHAHRIYIILFLKIQITLEHVEVPGNKLNRNPFGSTGNLFY